MPLEDSPSLDYYKDGLPEKLPDPQHKRRNIWKLILSLMVLSLAMVFIHLWQDGAIASVVGTGTVNGRVYDDNGNPIAAEVFVFGTNLSAQANTDGYFSLNSVPNGERTIIIAHRMVGREFKINVVAGQIVNMGDLRFQSEDFQNGWSQLME